MTQRLIARIREHQSGSPERARFADRLLQVVLLVDRNFSGEERDRLMQLLEETFQRYVDIGVNAQRARDVLVRLEADQTRLFEIIDFLVADPQQAMVH